MMSLVAINEEHRHPLNASIVQEYLSVGDVPLNADTLKEALMFKK